MTALVLTERDRELLAFLAVHRACTAELLAERFFSKNPFTGAPNTKPDKALERRLTALRRHGHVSLSRVRCDDGMVRAFVRPAAAADPLLGDRASRRVVPRSGRSHHVRTLEAVRAVEESVRRRGDRFVSFQVEAAYRAARQRGRRTRNGDGFESFPDAVCTIAVRGPAGSWRVVLVAVEYVTSKYTDADIAVKRASFACTFDDALWFADRPRTAERVQAITGGTCAVLP